MARKRADVDDVTPDIDRRTNNPIRLADISDAAIAAALRAAGSTASDDAIVDVRAMLNAVVDAAAYIPADTPPHMLRWRIMDAARSATPLRLGRLTRRLDLVVDDLRERLLSALVPDLPPAPDRLAAVPSADADVLDDIAGPDELAA